MDSFRFFTIFWRKKSHFRKKLHKYSAVYTAKFYHRIRFFGNFPHLVATLRGVENCETIQKLHLVVCGNPCMKIFWKPWFWQIEVFTRYRCFNASKWPQMPHKWVNTIPFGSGHTLGTLNHGWESLFCCFITLFGSERLFPLSEHFHHKNGSTVSIFSKFTPQKSQFG